MAIFSTGNGAVWNDLACVPGTRMRIADTIPTTLHPWTPLCYRRISYSGPTGQGADIIGVCQVGSSYAADQLKAVSCHRAFDEVVVTTMSASDVAWWESVLPAIGSNDGAGPASSVILFVAGNPYSSYVDRFLVAAKANPKVIVVVEGMHYESDGGDRNEEQAWLGRMRTHSFPAAQYGLCLNCADKVDAADKAYAASGPRARDADEAAVRDWIWSPTNGGGCAHVGAWTAYSSPSSLWLMGDAIFRGIRAAYGVAP